METPETFVLARVVVRPETCMPVTDKVYEPTMVLMIEASLSSCADDTERLVEFPVKYTVEILPTFDCKKSSEFEMLDAVSLKLIEVISELRISEPKELTGTAEIETC